MSEFAVTTNALTKRYGKQLAVDGIELRVPEESIYVLIGRNGAGKSTTFKLLLNLERADSGNAEVFGLDTVGDGARARAQIGYIAEQHEIANGWMTCRRRLQHSAAYYPTWDDNYAVHLSNALGVKLDRRSGDLSKGESRALQFVIALAHRPALLLFDEPNDGLDPVVRKRTQALLTEHLADTPTTLVISTHQIHEMESLADHVGVLRDGRLVAQMSRDELKQSMRRYRLEIPADWNPPADLTTAQLRRSSAGREAEVTVFGDEVVVTQSLTQSGARIQNVEVLTLEDAALALMTDEEI